MSFREILILITIIASTALAFAQGNTEKETQSGGVFKQLQEAGSPRPKQPAVLCSYMVLIHFKAVADVCFPDDIRTKKILDSGLSRIEDFIVQNAPATRDEVAKMRANFSPRVPDEVLCDRTKQFGWILVQHEASRARPDFDSFFEREIDALLAVPRKPELAPCL